MSFEDNVFINCPFDEEYHALLRPILFTTIYLGLKPRIALERSDSGEPRITKIIELIRESKYAIHDLSRLKARRKGEFFRLNMPFELGIDVGCRTFGGERWIPSVALSSRLIAIATKLRCPTCQARISRSTEISPNKLSLRCATG